MKKIPNVIVLYSADEKPNSNIVYLTGFSGFGVLVMKNNKQYLVVSSRDAEQAKKAKARIIVNPPGQKIADTVKQVIGNHRNEIGIDKRNTPLNVFESLEKKIGKKYVDVGEYFDRLRMVKKRDELELIKKACLFTDKVFSSIVKDFRFATEGEISFFIESMIMKAGLETAFKPIVASGDSASMPHYQGKKKLKKGFLLLDFGAKFKGYCSDMTRMLYLGRPTKEEIDDFILLYSVQNDLLARCHVGFSFSELDKRCRMLLGSKEKYFIHALGHSLGLDIHEYPTVGGNSEEKIQNNQVFTVEPGIYYEKRYGIRIEDTVCIINGRMNILTKSRKDLVIIK